jgi:protein-tyrosine phosphatase
VDYTGWGDLRVLVPHPHDPGVLLGAVGVLDALPMEVDAVVSLCRLGAAQVPERIPSGAQHRVWLLDTASHADNPHLEDVLRDAADAVAELRAEGRVVLLHCVQAQSRTPTVAAMYAARHLGVDASKALAQVCAALPNAHPNAAFRDAMSRVATGGTAARR